MAEEITSLHAVFVDQLKDLYSAETLIARALPKMAKAATAPDLKNGFKHHLEQTKVHAERIKGICASLKEKPTGKTCQATVGLVKEGEEAIEEDALPEMKDLMLIAAARRVEHYEMSGYTSACGLAKALGLKEALKTLATTLSEEKATDATLAKASVPAISKAFAAEKSAADAAAKKPDGVAEVGKVIKKIVKKIAG
jgi:ferritin-like metal-binding protein YciE